MKVTKTITINKPAEQVWDLVAHQFDKAHLWMGPIPHSEALGAGQSDTDAPMQGRICDLSDDPNGAKVKEVITYYSEEDKTLTFDVLPVNNPAIVPLKKNNVSMSVRSIGNNKSQVVWTASPQLKSAAFLFYPLLRLVFSMAFGNLLKGLKDYAERNLPNSATVKA